MPKPQPKKKRRAAPATIALLPGQKSETHRITRLIGLGTWDARAEAARLVRAALKKHHGSKRAAASELGVSYWTLSRWMTHLVLEAYGSNLRLLHGVGGHRRGLETLLEGPAPEKKERKNGS